MWNYISWFAIALLIVGGLNWGLVGLFGFNLVTFLFGSFPMLVKLIYFLVGLSAVYKLFCLFGFGCNGGSCCTK